MNREGRLFTVTVGESVEVPEKKRRGISDNFYRGGYMKKRVALTDYNVYAYAIVYWRFRWSKG